MFALAARADPYPQRRDWREIPWLDRAGERLRLMLFGRRRVSPARLAAFAAAVEAAQAWVDALDASGREQSLRAVRARLRRDGFAPDVVAEAFALVRRAAGEILGLRHFPTQIKGGYILLQGFIAEMDTGEGKTLTATLAVITAALAGWPVQVVTVNDYLAQRDAETLRPLYAAFGLSTGLALETLRPEEKRREYGADITYCTSKTLVFDYLRDRVALGERMRPLGMALSRLTGEAGAQIMLRGLHFAVVDEADSVFVDEARVPLIISMARQDAVAEAYFRQAVALARELRQPQDFRLQQGGRHAELSEAGRARLAQACSALTGLWTGALRREEAVLQALTALHGFQRDVHYIVRDGKVMIVDEHTGRVMPDRSWERGLQQMIEVKEGVAISPEKETLARISFQLFFRRYLRLAGMTGTCREVAGELGEVYGLGVVRVPPHRPSRRRTLPPRLFASADQRWQAVVAAVRERHQAGQPVLVGTRSILASEHLSGLLTAAGIPHQVLNAKQDGEEAQIVARAGEPGRVTIATNMAGRGTDIKLGPGVEALGGLHVMLTERHDNRRVDRQLAGRCARQGDPGSYEQMLSLEDELVRDCLPPINRLLRAWLGRSPDSSLARLAGRLYYAWAQRRTERAHRRIRLGLLQTDFRIRQSLSFSGQME